MIKTDQTIFKMGAGNCFAACIASLLEVPVESVVRFPDGECDNWRDIVNNWLDTKGYHYLDITLPDDLRDLFVKHWGYHVIVGDSPRFGDERHAVVGYKGNVFFDPHPSREGLAPGDWTYGFLIPKNIVLNNAW